MKKLAEMYKSATPKKWRKIGDALLSASTTLTTYSIANNWSKEISIIIMLTGVVGKFITNLASEDSTQN